MVRETGEEKETSSKREGIKQKKSVEINVLTLHDVMSLCNN